MYLFILSSLNHVYTVQIGNRDNKKYQFQKNAILNDNRRHQWPCTAHHCSAPPSCPQPGTVPPAPAMAQRQGIPMLSTLSHLPSEGTWKEAGSPISGMTGQRRCLQQADIPHELVTDTSLSLAVSHQTAATLLVKRKLPSLLSSTS